MKQNFTLYVCYFLYLGLATLLHPASNFADRNNSNCNKETVTMEEKIVAYEEPQILHGELLFKY